MTWRCCIYSRVEVGTAVRLRMNGVELQKVIMAAAGRTSIFPLPLPICDYSCTLLVMLYGSHVIFAALAAIDSSWAATNNIITTDWTQYVDPFIGTEGTVPGTAFNGGNTFPGAVLPFGSVKLGPDTTSFNTSIGQNAGYTPDGNVTGFSLTHVSGTGGGPVYGVVSQMPLVSLDNVNVLDNLTYMEPRAGNDIATVGYYKSVFQNGITTELSATSNVGILQYTFPDQTGGHVLVDVSHYLPANGGGYQSQFYANGNITVSEDGTSYYGWGVYKGAFSESKLPSDSESRVDANHPHSSRLPSVFLWRV